MLGAPCWAPWPLPSLFLTTPDGVVKTSSQYHVPTVVLAKRACVQSIFQNQCRRCGVTPGDSTSPELLRGCVADLRG